MAGAEDPDLVIEQPMYGPTAWDKDGPMGRPRRVSLLEIYLEHDRASWC